MLVFRHLCIMIVSGEEKKENDDHVHGQVGEDQAPVPLHTLHNYQSEFRKQIPPQLLLSLSLSLSLHPLKHSQ